jgi:hypothetical protein
MAQGFPGHGVRYVLHSFGHVEMDVVIQHYDTASEHGGAFSLDGDVTLYLNVSISSSLMLEKTARPSCSSGLTFLITWKG